MAKGKGRRVREQGKLRFSNYFKNFEDGDNIAVKIDAGVRVAFPKRLQGRSGKITGSRGTFKLAEIKDNGKAKTFIIHPVHLRKLA